MYPSTNTRSGHTTSTETTTLSLDPSTSYYVAQTYINNIIRVLFYEQEAKFKETVNALIANQDTKVDKRVETQLRPLSLQVKYLSSDLSSFTINYNVRLEKMINNKKISTKFEIARTETEQYLNTKFEIQIC